MPRMPAFRVDPFHVLDIELWKVCRDLFGMVTTFRLPANHARQQGEAAKGTMMAAQSGWVMEEQVKTCRRRRVPPAATLENPPGNKKCGSAWQLPEIKVVMSNVGASVVQFNTCSFQAKQKSRWFKPGQFVGKLEGFEQLASQLGPHTKPWWARVRLKRRGSTRLTWPTS